MATINGTAGADTLNGTTAADTINGAGGNDIIRGNGNTSGTDVLNGDAGDDTIYTGSGANNVHGGIGNDTLIGTNQTTFQDVLHGDDGNDIINGGGGRDFLYGEAGNDTIDTGADVPASNGISTVVSGGDGDDQIYSAGGVSDLRGDAGNDIFHANQGLWNGSEQYSGGADFDQIVADASNQNIGIASISGVERITGGAFSNISVQTQSVSTGQSTFLDLRGIELVNISQIKGQGGNDFIILEGGAGTGNAALARNDVVNGGAGNDTIYAGLGDDTINGDAGNDTLGGGAGRDLLTGGTGADTFLFTNLTDSEVGVGADRIFDFSAADSDKIRLSDLDADAGSSGDQAFTFIGSTAFSGIAGELRAELGSDGLTHIFGDVNADSSADFEIIVTNAATLSGSDFVL